MTETSFSYFIKGDISGIQDFIFNVKSEKAARVLKARSIIIQLISDFALNYVRHKSVNSEVLFDGGGNFYLWANLSNTEVLKRLQVEINDRCYINDFGITITWVENSGSFGEIWEKVNAQSQLDKLDIYEKTYRFFEPYSSPFLTKKAGKANTIEELDDVQRFAQNLPKVVKKLVPSSDTEFNIDAYSTSFLGKSLKLGKGRSSEREHLFAEKITTLLPNLKGFNRKPEELRILDVYRDKLEEIRDFDEKEVKKLRGHFVTDFEMLAYFAEERTGTAKLGILKMDVDNLGSLFNKMPSEAIASELSQALKSFFEEELLSILDQDLPDYLIDDDYKSEGRAYKIGDNVYIIFAGGDDCFVVGAWDAIFVFAKKVNDAFGEQLFNQGEDTITLSAGIVVVHAKYPVVRFAEIAEEALSTAKSHLYYNESSPSKNKICVFDEVLTWKEFSEAHDFVKKLSKTIRKNKGNRAIRALLNKIQQSADEFRIQHHAAEHGEVHLPSVSKLFYVSRDWFKKEKANPDLLSKTEKELQSMNDKVVSGLVNNYYSSLMGAFAGTATNPMKYPIIARWTELLTRKINADE